jgi:hypothetical protein
LIAVETIRHQLALAVRVDDHFAIAPAPRELRVTIDSQESSIRTIDDVGTRHDDGTYRFVAPVTAGPRQITVAGDDTFTWTPTTPVVLPLVNPRVPVVIETWPTANARVPAGTLAIRGRMIPDGAAPPVAPGQEVRIEAFGITTPRNRRTRGDATGEFLFLVLGQVLLTAGFPPADKRQKVRLAITAPGRTVASIDVFEGATVTTFPGSPFAVLPGRESRVLIKLS